MAPAVPLGYALFSMAFLLRGVPVTAATLRGTLPARDSLYSVANSADPALMVLLRGHWDAEYQRAAPLLATAYRPAIAAFTAIEGWWRSGYGDRDIARLMYACPRGGEMPHLTGHANADAFADAFEAARDEAFYIVFLPQPLSVNALNSYSFPATYLHRDVEDLFVQRAHSFNAAVMRHRVLETARIMFRILWGNMNGAWRAVYQKRSLITTLLLGMMHNRMLRNYMARGHTLYNQSSVAFTLLTFCYVPAEQWIHAQNRSPRGYAFDEQRWYFFWRIFGSLLGISERFLPRDHDDAQLMWHEFFASGECQGNPHVLDFSQPGFARLDPNLYGAYRGANRVQPDGWSIADLLSFLPSWLVTQLRTSPRWVSFLAGR